MNKKITIVFGIVIILIIVVLYSGTNRIDNTATKDTGIKKEVADTADMMDKSETMMSTDTKVIVADKKAGLYETYSPEKLARAESGDVVLFFHASWCPTCRGLSANIEKNLEAIPPKVSILKVDYDTESELKKKYGVTYQHTLVQVDKNGNMIKKWSGSPTLGSLVSQIN